MENIGDIIGLVVIFGVVALKAISNALSNQQQRERESGSKTAESKSDGGGFSWEDWGWEPEAATSVEPAPKRKTQSAAKPKDKLSSPPASGYPEPAAQETVAAYQKLDAGEGYSWDAPEAPEEPGHSNVHQQAYQAWGESAAQQSPEGVEAADVSATSIADESFQYAFPEAMRKVRRLRRGTRAPIVLKIRGREDMRRAILVREVLMRPRAYDI